jgi:penicillin-binding protein 1B
VARRLAGFRKTRLAKWWRRGPIWRRIRIAAGASFLVLTFALGFYLAGLYENISTLIEERHAALTSAIFSAPTMIQVGDDIDHLNLLERLKRLSYTQTQSPTSPGEFAVMPGAMWINVREFSVGTSDHPAALMRLVLHGKKITGLADSYGLAEKRAELEPEVIGRLLPGAPAERVEVRLGDLPPYLVQGLLDTEDRWFYYHPGFNPFRILEAALNDFRSHHLNQGASTITQQLARTFMDRHERSFSRKFRELAVALVIEFRLSKNAILERYINDVPMGEFDGTPIEGMPLAARYFFNKDLHEVTPVEAATLIGMIQAPTAYDPRRHPDLCRKRRDTVLVIMRVHDLIDQPTYIAATAALVQVAKMPGLRRAPYFTDYVTAFVNRLPGVSGHLDGFKVYSTLDPEYQTDAQEAVESNLARLEKSRPRLRHKEDKDRLQSAMVALDTNSGAIVAMVGGRDYPASQFNRVTQAQRQPGSAFKPIVYLAAMDPDRSPLHPPLTLASTLPDEPISFNGWIPANYERTYQPQVTVVEALSESLNVPTAYVGNELGPPLMVRTAHEMGIRSDLPAVLPMAIGADEVTLLELTSAYQTFANMGEQATPYAVESVVDGVGRQIYHHTPQTSEVIDPNVAYLMTGGLKAVLSSGTGASSSRLGIDFPAAGKTGTTQDYKDGYFIGYTPAVVCGVWVGFDQPAPTGMTGAQSALPAWVDFMVSTAPDDAQDFAIPSGIEMAAIDPTSGGLATPACPHVFRLPFLIGSAPTQLCPLHSGGLLASMPAPAPPELSAPAAEPSPAPAAAPSATNSDIFGKIGSFFGSLFKP